MENLLSTKFSLQIRTTSPEQSGRIGQLIGKNLRAGDILCLSGELGAGKTTLTAAIGAGWGSLERFTSPTYTLVHVHHHPEKKQTLYHMDAYRLESTTSIESIGIDDYFNTQDVMIIEWAERVQDFLPDDRLWITIFYDDNVPSGRTLLFQTDVARYQVLLQHLKDAVDDSGH